MPPLYWKKLEERGGSMSDWHSLSTAQVMKEVGGRSQGLTEREEIGRAHV